MATSQSSYEKQLICLADVLEDVFQYTETELEYLKQYFNIVMASDAETHKNSIRALVFTAFPSVVDIAEQWIQKLPNLTALVGISSGYDTYYWKFKRYGIPIANVPNAVTIGTADHAMSLLLACGSDLIKGLQHCLLSNEPKKLAGCHRSIGITNKTLGIVGLGNVGTAVCKRASGFDMNLLYHSPTRKDQDLENNLKVTFYAQLDKMLPVCDYVIVACTLNAQTQSMFGENQFKLMKRTAAFINISRGDIVNQDALITALQSRTIRMAALDVTSPEILPADHTLRGLDNVIITPHMAFQTEGNVRSLLQGCVENLRAILYENKPMPNELKIK